MNKKAILMNLTERLKNKLKNNPTDVNLKLIEKIFENKLWYSKVELDTFVNILIDLGYLKEDALNLYLELITDNL